MEVYPCNEKWEAGFPVPHRRAHVQARSIGPSILEYGFVKGIIPQKFVAVRLKLVYKTQFSVRAYCKAFRLGQTDLKPSISVV